MNGQWKWAKEYKKGMKVMVGRQGCVDADARYVPSRNCLLAGGCLTRVCQSHAAACGRATPLFRRKDLNAGRAHCGATIESRNNVVKQEQAGAQNV